jgi:hypothetical protein
VRFSSSRLGLAAIFFPLLHVVGRPVIFSVGRNEPSGRCCGTRVSAYPDRIGAHSISVLARSVCWSEQQRLEVIGRRLGSGPEGIRRTYGDQRGTKPSSKPLNWPLLAAQPLPFSITEFAHKAANGKFPLAAATGTAPSARVQPRAPGWPSARPTCCRSDTSTSSSRSRRRSPTSRSRTRPSSTICCSRRHPRRC